MLKRSHGAQGMLDNTRTHSKDAPMHTHHHQPNSCNSRFSCFFSTTLLLTFFLLTFWLLPACIWLSIVIVFHIIMLLFLLSNIPGWLTRLIIELSVRDKWRWIMCVCTLLLEWFKPTTYNVCLHFIYYTLRKWFIPTTLL